jgi:hypothetical protein
VCPATHARLVRAKCLFVLYHPVMHHDTFNADFYVVAATVIPVLYLALTLQGSTFESLLAGWESNMRANARHARLNRAVLMMFPVLAYLLMVTGYAGELAAIFALYNRSSSGGAGPVALISVIGLMLAVLATLTIRMLGQMRRVRLLARQRKRRQNPGQLW